MRRIKPLFTIVFLFIVMSSSYAQFNCGDILTDERDGKEYATVLIGEQCWMAENLNVGTMLTQNGSNHQTDNATIEKYCYNNNEAECDEYGGLYQWHEMMQYQTEESSQGICPDGWHLPSDVEFMQMEMHLGMSEEDANDTGAERGTDEGIQLQVDGGTGFDALFGGIWYQDLDFVYNEDFASPNPYGSDFYFTYFWSTTPGNYTDSYYYRNVCSRIDQMPTITRWEVDWNFGYSVRCIADVSNSYNFEYNGKNYEIFKELKTWEDAAADAVSKGGYLVEINDQNEQDAIYDAIINGAEIPTDYVTINNGGGIAYVWIGATDKTTEGTWLWDGNDDTEGTNFWTGQGANGSGNGQAIDDAYYNWGGTSQGTPNEPDNYGANQNAGAIALAGWPSGTTMLGVANEWNDIINTSELYYIIEYDETQSINYINKINFEIYPNPTSDFITINSENIEKIETIRLISITGAKTYQMNTNNIGSIQIDMNYLPAGIYFIALYDKNNKLIGNEKIIK